MLQRALKDLNGKRLLGRDGEVGAIKDVLFDDAQWAARYLVVRTGSWLSGRDVLVSPFSVESGRLADAALTTQLSRGQIEKAPGIDTDPPISRILEQAYAAHYGYPYYWSGPHLWGYAATPASALEMAGRAADANSVAAQRALDSAERRAEDASLRSAREVGDYRIHAADGDIGHVEDFLVDAESWAIESMVVDTRNWLPGKKVLVPPSAISGVDWHTGSVDLRFTRAELEQAPEASSS
jgi:hypothetical protein